MSKLKKHPIIQDDKIIGYEQKEKEIKIVVCNKKEADEIIIANHYSHKATKNSFLSFLVYYKDKVREFDRMWLSDEMPKYSETITLSLLHHYLRKVHPEIKYLISYADNSSDVGNEGTIYKAANYKLIDKVKSDFYILESGERVHPVTMWHRHGTRKWAFLVQQYPNIKKADGFQMKYLFEL